jgi:nitrite reductase/ring-hydroxylating ferredoxin subunit
VVDGCFTCPWHGSHFDARNGQVRRGPASVPQPAYETRTEAGAVQVRRLERRALRSNAV